MRSKLAALLAAAAACLAAASLFATSRRVAPSAPGEGSAEDGPPRRLVAEVGHSDAYAATVLSVANDAPGDDASEAPGIGASDHARITEMLGRAGDLRRRAREGDKGAPDMADAVFGEARRLIGRSVRRERRRRGMRGGRGAVAREDEGRALDVAAQAVRHLYDQAQLSGKDTIGFSECQGRLLKHCRTIINRYLRENGLLRGRQRIDIQVLHKRPVERDPNDEGSNKVVIITNALGDAVAEVPKYPDGWTWNGRAVGPWPSCVGQAPEDCCLLIREDVPDRENERDIECQFFTPEIAETGVVRYPRPRDNEGNPVNGIIMYESLDPDGRGRVEETPYIQADFDLPNRGGGQGGGRRSGGGE